MLCPKKVKTEKLKIETNIQNLIFTYSLTFKFKLLSYCRRYGHFKIAVYFLIALIIMRLRRPQFQGLTKR
jgi:hypothetical protein